MKDIKEEATVYVHPNKIGIKEGMGYMLGDAGNLFVLTYVSSYLKIFFTDVLKLQAQKVANLFLFTRLWDAVNDPLWGALVAKHPPTKDGKFRPYLKWVAVPLALSELLCFFNLGKFTQNAGLLLAFGYVTYIAFGMLYTGMNVPFGSLASVITDDPDGRTLLSTFRSIGGGIGGAAPLLLAPMVIYTKSFDANGARVDTANAGGMFTFAVIMAALSVAFYFACYKTTKERVKSEAEPKVDMKKTYGAMLRSRPFLALAVTGILISGQLQFSSLNQYLYKNYFCNTGLSIIGTIAQYLPMAIMIPFTPKLVKKFGKKELSGLGSVFAAAAAVATFLLKPAPDKPWIFLGLLFVIGFGYSFVSITNWAVVADVIDYQDYYLSHPSYNLVTWNAVDSEEKQETDGTIRINRKKIISCILLSIPTCGLYYIYWKYLLVKNIKAMRKDESSCTGEMLCLVFVPFYSYYWWFTRGKIVKDEFASHGYSASGNEIVYLLLCIFGLEFVSMAIMQNDFNSLPYEFVVEEPPVGSASTRSESAIYAVYTFCRKLGQTAADYGGLMLLGKVGYTDAMATRGFVPGVSEGILKICTLIPAVTYTLIFLLYQFGYPLTKKRLEPVYAYVRQTNAANETADAPPEST